MLPKVTERARGQWRGILRNVGIPEQALQNKHGPCPICAGTDRFRWDNKDGRGTWICNHCGAGDGIDLVMKFKQLGFAEAAREVERASGGVTSKDPVAPKVSEEDSFRRIKALLESSHQVEQGDETDKYLTARGVGEPKVYPGDLRSCPRCWYANGLYFPAMVAIVRDTSGVVVNLHRTFLSDGRKAAVDDPRRLMQGSLPAGSAVRLGPVNRVLGIAEGIETALAACHFFEMPVWAALNAGNLSKWVPPKGVEEVVIFGDNDENFTGQSSAFQLANRLKLSGLSASVCIPDRPNTDWADQALDRHLARQTPINND